MSDSTRPSKPHPDYPLSYHPSRRWCKKIRGKLHYFGKAIANDGGASAQAALDLWLLQKDDLLAGRVPRSKQGASGPTLRDLCNRFLTTKQARLDAGDLARRTFRDYFAICEELIAELGKDRLLTDIRPADLEQLRVQWSKRWGVVRLGAEVNRAKVVLRFAWTSGMIPSPILTGESFRKPSKRVMRLHRAEQPAKFFEREEVLRLLSFAGLPMRAMIHLGLNCGLGTSDVAHLRLAHLDLENAWMDYARNKTGVDRRCWLWPETVQAIREWLSVRSAPKDEAHADLIFINELGNPFLSCEGNQTAGRVFTRLAKKAGVKGRGFYSLRHNFQTIADNTKDSVAVGKIMGHERGGMADNYREKIDDQRLIDVAEHVRRWLFGTPVNG